jgi:hypothetical protein
LFAKEDLVKNDCRAVRFAFAALFVCVALASSSCSSKSELAATSDGDGGDCGSAPVSFQSDVVPVFAASCTSSSTCHGQTNNAFAENLYLGQDDDAGTDGSSESGAVYAELLADRSLEDPSMNLVTAGDLEDSYLWHKVNGDQNTDPTVMSGCQPAATGSSPCSDCVSAAPCGVQMPFSGSLDPAAACIIRSWIAQGAKND